MNYFQKKHYDDTVIAIISSMVFRRLSTSTWYPAFGRAWAFFFCDTNKFRLRVLPATRQIYGWSSALAEHAHHPYLDIKGARTVQIVQEAGDTKQSFATLQVTGRAINPQNVPFFIIFMVNKKKRRFRDSCFWQTQTRTSTIWQTRPCFMGWQGGQGIYEKTSGTMKRHKTGEMDTTRWIQSIEHNEMDKRIDHNVLLTLLPNLVSSGWFKLAKILFQRNFCLILQFYSLKWFQYSKKAKIL